jgi:hypothetical protein
MGLSFEGDLESRIPKKMFSSALGRFSLSIVFYGIAQYRSRRKEKQNALDR